MSAWRDNTERISQQENVSGLLVLDDENLPMMGEQADFIYFYLMLTK